MTVSDVDYCAGCGVKHHAIRWRFVGLRYCVNCAIKKMKKGERCS